MSATLSSIPPPSVPVADSASRPVTDKSSLQAGSTEEQQQVQELSARDREVRLHEMAHKAAGGGITGAISYTYERGPDGRMYAVGGEVSIDTSAVPGDPEATLEKAEAIIRAAMAPAEPSAQDYRVASRARAMAAEARAEIARMETSGEDDRSAAGAQVAEDTAQTEPVEEPNRLQQLLAESGVFAPTYVPGTVINARA